MTSDAVTAADTATIRPATGRACTIPALTDISWPSKSADLANLTRTGAASRDFTHVDIAGLDAGRAPELGQTFGPYARRAVRDAATVDPLPGDLRDALDRIHSVRGHTNVS